MGIKLTPIKDHKAGDTSRGVIFSIEQAEDSKEGWQPSLKWKIRDIDTDQTIIAFCTMTLTPRSKLGKWIVNLTGSLSEVDTDELIGATVTVHWDNHATNAEKVVISNLTTRTPTKGEDVGQILKDALAAEELRDLEAPF